MEGWRKGGKEGRMDGGMCIGIRTQAAVNLNDRLYGNHNSFEIAAGTSRCVSLLSSSLP